MNLAWIGALVITAIGVAVGRKLAVHVGLVDKPDQRKKHIGNVPLIGGIAIYIGILSVLLITGRYDAHIPFLAGAFLIVATGVWDDIKGLSPYVRLAAQAGAIALVAFWGGLYIFDLGNIMPDGSLLDLGRFGVPFTIIAGVGLINAFNMTDGLDGLCGSLALAALTGVLAMAASVGTNHMDVRFVLVLSGAIVGFLLFNFPFPGRGQATAFLGDAGSYLLGFSVLYAIMLLSQGQNRAMPPVSGLWFCLLPLLDMGGILIRRIIRRRSPFNADREHLHHVFTLAKFSVTETTGAMALTALVAVLLGTNFVFQGVSEFGLFIGFLAIAAVYLWRMLRAWKRLRFFSRSIDRRVQNSEPGTLLEDRRKSVVLEVANDPNYERRSGTERRTKKKEKAETPTLRPAAESPESVRARQNG